MATKGEIPRSMKKGSRRRRCPRKDTDDEEENRLPNQGAVLVDDHDDDDCAKDENRNDENNLKILGKLFRKAEETIQMDVWKTNDALRRAVLRASLLLGSLDDGTDFLLLLNEHESSLIKSCRTLVKEATEQKEEKHQLPRLFLATHTVRALARFINKVPTQEALMQLLYHMINILGNGKFNSHRDLVYLAFEALHHIFLRYKKDLGTSILSFATVAAEQVFLFPIPKIRKGSGVKVNSNGLAIDKLFTIAIQSILIIGKAILAQNESSLEDNSLPDFLCRLGKPPLSIARHLLSKTAVEWVHIQARITKIPKDGLSYCKRIHRLLWEQASVANRNPVECLEMRRDSILVLLTGESKILCQALESKFAEAACTYAWKTSTAYMSQSSPGSCDYGPLLQFHQTIGSLLDRVYEKKFGLSYLEYCSLRAQHIGIYTKVWIGRSDSEYIQTEGILKVALLSVAVNRRLAAADDGCNELLENASNIIAAFRSVLIDSSSEWNWSFEDCARILKIIPINALHKSLYGVAKDDGLTAGEPLALHTGACLMVQCFGPFLLKAAGKLKEERTELSEKAVDCFIRGMSVFELEIQQSTESTDHLPNVINEVLAMSSQHRLISTGTVSHFERLAKFLSSTGRQREQKGSHHSSLSLQVASLRLFTEVSPLITSSSADIMLSQRWSCLASFLASNNLFDASVIAGMVSLIYDAIESGEEENFNIDTNIELFGFICARSDGMLDLSHCLELQNLKISDRRRGIILRVLRSLDKLERSSFVPDGHAKPSVLTVSSILECLDQIATNEDMSLVDHIEGICNVSLSLSGLLRVLLPRNVVPTKRSTPADVLTRAKLKMVLDLMQHVGNALSTDVFVEDESSHRLLFCHKTTVQLALHLLKQLQDDFSSSDFQAIAASAIYCCAATSIVPIDFAGVNWVNDEILGDSDSKSDNLRQKMKANACAMVTSARSFLSNCQSEEWRDLCVAIKPVLLCMYDRYTSGVRNSSELQESIQIAMETLSAPDDCDIPSPKTLGAHIAVSCLTRQADFLHTRGEGFAALRLAEWSYRVATQLDRNDKQWFEVSYLRKLSPSTIFDNIHRTESAETTCNCVSIDEMELQGNRIGCQVAYFVDGPSADKMCCLLETRLKKCKELLRDQPREHFVRSCWLHGTLVQILANSYSARGDFERAVSLCKDCLRLCKQALVASSRQLSSFSRYSGSPLYDSTTFQRLRERQTDLLLTLASLVKGSGDHRRADTYVYSAVKGMGSKELCNTLELAHDPSTMMKSLYELRLDNPRLSELRRVIWEFAIAKSSPDQYSATTRLLPKNIDNVDLTFSYKDDGDLDSVLEGVARLRLCDITGESGLRSTFWGQTRDALSGITSTLDLSVFVSLVSGEISPAPKSELDLLEARNLFRKHEYEEYFREEVTLKRLCDRISKAPLVSPSQRSESLYMLGLLHLRLAREDGTLTRLWHGSSNHEGTKLQFETGCVTSLANARSCFVEALSIRGPASDHLTRDILRCLALVSGTEDDARLQMASWEMIHGSIGSSIRQKILQAFAPGGVSDNDIGDECRTEISTVLRSLDCPFFSQERVEHVNALVEVLENKMPSNWRVLAVVLCPTGEVLMNSVQIQGHFSSRTVCIFPSGEESVYATMMQPLDELISQSQGQLQGEFKATESGTREAEDSRRKWWSRREQIDDDLERLCRRVEKYFFSSENAQAMLQGDCESQGDFESDGSINDWNAQKAYPASFAVDSPLKDGTNPLEMRVTELRGELVNMGFQMRDIRKMKKPELAALLREERLRRQAQTKIDSSTQSSHFLNEHLKESKNFTLLILDEDLHRFPFEALPCLRGKYICRSPSIPMVATKLLELNNDEHSNNAQADPKNSSYILDPESNLQATRERIHEFLESKRHSLDCEWEGVVGEAPSQDFFTRNLVRDDSMFLFFGHGGGQAYFSRSAIESLIMPGERRIKSSVFLMGCSSGRLVSVNRRKLNSPRKVPLVYEPEGLALSYLAAGAPCVIGNLWDVTDRDIDRFAMDLLDRFYGGQDMVASLAHARSVCKMKYLNGYAPVYYGIPVTNKKTY